MIRAITRWWRRTWASLNYRYCKSNAYLAAQRHEVLVAVGWSQQAADWNEEWNKWR